MVGTPSKTERTPNLVWEEKTLYERVNQLASENPAQVAVMMKEIC